jgi:hypothetical protein
VPKNIMVHALINRDAWCRYLVYRCQSVPICSFASVLVLTAAEEYGFLDPRRVKGRLAGYVVSISSVFFVVAMFLPTAV